MNQRPLSVSQANVSRWNSVWKGGWRTCGDIWRYFLGSCRGGTSKKKGSGPPISSHIWLTFSQFQIFFSIFESLRPQFWAKGEKKLEIRSNSENQSWKWWYNPLFCLQVSRTSPFSVQALRGRRGYTLLFIFDLIGEKEKKSTRKNVWMARCKKLQLPGVGNVNNQPVSL